MSTLMLWRSVDQFRLFLIPDGHIPASGTLAIRSLQGQVRHVDDRDLVPFEVTEDQGRRWAKDQLGEALGEIRGSIDEKLADWRRRLDEFNRTPVKEGSTVTPNTASAFLDFLKQLPGVLGNSLSGDEHRVDRARDAMADLQQRLKNAGIDLDERFTGFPDRLADLRKDVERERAAKKARPDDLPPGEP